ncbi:MAG: ThuA domain-containing protein [Verrucomicrobiota bacterium]
MNSLLVSLLLSCLSLNAWADHHGTPKKVVFIAGPQSHALGHHEHHAGCLLLSRYLNEHFGQHISARVIQNGWPEDTTPIEQADAVVFYSDGQTRHVGYYHRRQLNLLKEKGVGFGAIHYAVEMLPDDSNQDLISWIGGAFEIHYSVNPHWDAVFDALPTHPITRGVEPFTIHDEWYFNMRFAEENVTPILSAIPPGETMNRKDGHHSGNPVVRSMVEEKRPQHLCWTYDRADGGRGFGFTGGHFHQNWQNDNFRKIVLNAIAWIAKVEVPKEGVQTPTPSEEDMGQNLDRNQKPPRPRKPVAAQS